MATVTLELQDNFGELRTKFNSLSGNVGDLTTLQTNNTTSLVDAINGVDSDLSTRVPNIFDRSGTLLNG